MRHSAFIEPRVYPIWCWNARTLRERSHGKIRERAEAFINEIGADSVISVTEHAPIFGPFSVVVWYRELTDDGQLVGRAADENRSA